MSASTAAERDIVRKLARGSFLSRLVTQMYFPGDYLFPFDPIFNSVTDERDRARMISTFDLENTIPDWALCFRFDIVLRGRDKTPEDMD